MSKHTVLYDDGCAMCVSQMRALGWLDWFSVLVPVPLSDPRAKEIAPRLTRGELLAAIHCITRKGCVYRGARAIRFIGMRLPLLAPAALFLWLPGVIWIAEIVYAWVSRNRLHLSRVFGCGEAPHSITTKRGRERDKAACKSGT